VLWNDVCNRSTSAHAAAYRTVFRINQQYGTSLCQISGWAQVNGFRGETKELIEMKDRVDFDIWYIENWSHYWILKSFTSTVFNVFKGEEKA
jgi:lipopolysaccharide/colanic/teichoic acid biosynthesis glycosyltransferase